MVLCVPVDSGLVVVVVRKKYREKIRYLEGRVTTLQGCIADQAGRIREQQERVRALQKRPIYMVGDRVTIRLWGSKEVDGVVTDMRHAGYLGYETEYEVEYSYEQTYSVVTSFPLGTPEKDCVCRERKCTETAKVWAPVIPQSVDIKPCIVGPI